MKKALAFLLCGMLCLAVFSASAETAGKIHLELFSLKVETVDILNTLIERFEAENPDIDVEQTQVPDAMQVLQTRAATNSLPDIITHWAFDPRFREMAKNNAFMDLTDQDLFATVKKDLLEETRYQDKLYILPISTNAAGVFYNTEIFKEQDIQIPTTHEELIAVCKKLKEAGIVPFEMHSMDWQPYIVGEMTMLNCFEDYKAVNAELIAGTKKVRDYPEFEHAAQLMRELYEYGQQDAMGTGYDQALAAFANGETAMIIQGIWIIPSVKTLNPQLSFSSFPLPAEAGKKTRVPYQNDIGYCISESCPHKDAALKFLAFIAKEESAQYYADMDGSASYVQNVVSSVKESQPVLERFNAAENIAVWPDQLWSAGGGDTYISICQQLLADQDMEGYLNSMQDLFDAK